MTANRHWGSLNPALLFSGMLLTCSCVTHPLPSSGNSPAIPSLDTPVRIKFPASFEIDCASDVVQPESGESTELFMGPNPDPAILFAHHIEKIESFPNKFEDAVSVVTLMVDGWLSAKASLDRDYRTVWANEAEQIHTNAVDRILTPKQRMTFMRLRYRGMPRSQAWTRVALTSSQIQQIESLYLQALQALHPAGAVASAMPCTARRHFEAVRRTLGQTSEETLALLKAVEKPAQPNEHTGAALRMARRRELALRAELEVAENDSDRIRLRKALADLRAEVTDIEMHGRLSPVHLTSQTWRVDELRNFHATLERCLEDLAAIQALDTALRSKLKSWDGRLLAITDPKIGAFQQNLSQSILRAQHDAATGRHPDPMKKRAKEASQ